MEDQTNKTVGDFKYNSKQKYKFMTFLNGNENKNI